MGRSKRFTEGEVSDEKVSYPYLFMLFPVRLSKSGLVLCILCLGIGKLHGTVSTLGVQRGRGQKQRRGCVNWAGPMGIGGGGVIRKTGDRQDAN